MCKNESTILASIIAVFSPGFFEGVVGCRAGVRARRWEKMLGNTNLLLLLPLCSKQPPR